MYKVSVIMPVYNAEEYLRNALDSVINQSMDFENIELILVDDKSSDNSRSIIEEYSSKYSNIKPIFLEENSGCPGIPRNIGIKNATSDYIMFIDNDDEYFPEICDKLYNTIISEDADIVACNVLCTDNLGSREWLFDSDDYVFGDEIIYFDNVFVWTCIFKKSIILNNNICFIDGINEDTIFTIEYYMHSKKLVYLKDFNGYHHFDRSDSTSLISFDWEINIIKSFDKIVKILEGTNYDLNRIFKHKIQTSIMRAIILDNKNEINGVLSSLYDFERKINFKSNLSILSQVINFFILQGKLNIATYLCLFISKLRNSNLLLKIHRKFF